MIEFKNISKEFKLGVSSKSFFALKNISFNLEAGKLIGFLGANGAGKTTLIKTLLKFIFPTSGEIILNEKFFGIGAKDFFEKMAYVPERPYYYPELTGFEFLRYMGSLSNVKKNEIEMRTKEWTERFHIDFALSRRLKTYSKGMLARLSMTASLISNPILLILDEPLSGLDPIGRKDIKDALVDLNKNGKTIFFSSHILSDVEEICHKVVFFERGELKFEGPIDHLIYKNAVNSFVLTYIENDMTKQRIVSIEEKDRVIGELISQGQTIYSLIPEKLSLEEVIYKI